MRDKIISKSEELFLSLGFKSVTMDDIANAIGISKKTIYAHFSNKTALVEVVIFETLDHIYEGIDKINASSINPIEELYDIKLFVMNYFKNERVSPQYQLKKLEGIGDHGCEYMTGGVARNIYLHTFKRELTDPFSKSVSSEAIMF